MFGRAGSPEEHILWNFSFKDHVMSMLLYHQQVCSKLVIAILPLSYLISFLYFYSCLYLKVNLSVIASLANGTLAVFRKLQNVFADKLPLFSKKADIVNFEKEKWSNIDVRFFS